MKVEMSLPELRHGDVRAWWSRDGTIPVAMTLWHDLTTTVSDAAITVRIRAGEAMSLDLEKFRKVAHGHDTGHDCVDIDRKLLKDFNEACPAYEKWNDRARRLRRS